MSESARTPSPEHTAAFVFTGFDSPNTTQVPDAFFDVVAPQLSEAELRVALYIIRRTFGFKKDSDTISLRQMVDGITTKDGRVLDRGTGLKKSAVANALNGLERKGVILSRRNQSRERGHEPTTYALHIKHHPLSVPVDKGVSTGTDKPLSVPVDTQYTVLQHTEEQHTDRNSTSFDRFAMIRQNGKTSGFSKKSSNFAKTRVVASAGSAAVSHSPTAVGEIIARRLGTGTSAMAAAPDEPLTSVPGDAPSRPKRAPKSVATPPTPPESQDVPSRAATGPKRGRPPQLSPYLEDLIDRYSAELHDEEHQPQNRGQAARLWRSSGRSEAAFGRVLVEAKAITLERDIKKRATVGGEFGARNKMPYYFTVLRDLLGMKDARNEEGRGRDER
jgi:hypothetical protein